MRASSLRAWLPFACLFVFSLLASPTLAQTGTISGRVVDAETGDPLRGATVQVVRPGGAEVAGAPSGEDGGFRFEVAPGTYSVVVTLLGHETRRLDGIRVSADARRPVTVALVERAVALNPIVVTASRTEESRIEAPATVAVVEREEIREQSAPTVVDHVKGQVGVDVSQTGIQQSNVVTRGFNNVFSGALLVIQDYRYARVPSLRVNAYNLIPTTNLDLDHVEVVLGPGAALYGPNSASGVLHMLSTSPIDDPGTTVSLAGGEQEIFQGIARHASKIGDNAVFAIRGKVDSRRCGRISRFFCPVICANGTHHPVYHQQRKQRRKLLIDPLEPLPQVGVALAITVAAPVPPVFG
ncbi:MAG: carboxypeptidase regulatory-like domain-containing protein, partial [Gemmatimonadota bacterium]|nr:carboxypeptidase regulatory-like domain-containing protein [Gemmatimonadota bacterium]